MITHIYSPAAYIASAALCDFEVPDEKVAKFNEDVMPDDRLTESSVVTQSRLSAAVEKKVATDLGALSSPPDKARMSACPVHMQRTGSLLCKTCHPLAGTDPCSIPYEIQRQMIYVGMSRIPVCSEIFCDIQ